MCGSGAEKGDGSWNRMSKSIHVKGTEYEKGEEGAYMWKAARKGCQSMSG